MKRTILCAIIALVATACASQKPETTIATQVSQPTATATPTPCSSSVTVMSIQPEGYQSLLHLIMTKGVPVSQNDTQYTFFDKNDNRNGVIAIHKPDNGPRKDAKPVQISVWVNGKLAKPGKQFFSYIIHEDGSVIYDPPVDPCTGTRFPSQGPDRANEVRDAVNEMLERAKALPTPKGPITSKDI